MYEISPEVQEKFNQAKAAIEEVQQIRVGIRERESEKAKLKESIAEVERQIGEVEASSFSSKIVRVLSDGAATGKNLEAQLINLLDQERLIEAKLSGLRRLEQTAVENLPQAQKQFEAARSEWARKTMAAYRTQVRAKALELVDAYEFGLMLASLCDDRYFSMSVVDIRIPDPNDGLKDLMSSITTMAGNSRQGETLYRASKWDGNKPGLKETFERLSPVSDLQRQLKRMVQDIEKGKPEKSAIKVA